MYRPVRWPFEESETIAQARGIDDINAGETIRDDDAVIGTVIKTLPTANYPDIGAARPAWVLINPVNDGLPSRLIDDRAPDGISAVCPYVLGRCEECGRLYIDTKGVTCEHCEVDKDDEQDTHTPTHTDVAADGGTVIESGGRVKYNGCEWTVARANIKHAELYNGRHVVAPLGDIELLNGGE